jgi:hypothetical protein
VIFGVPDLVVVPCGLDRTGKIQIYNYVRKIAEINTNKSN